MKEKENAKLGSELADNNNTTDNSGEERLQKLLSRAGIASRRAAEKLIADGQVSVNGEIVTELGAKAHPTRDRISVSGKPLRVSDDTITVVLLHKPRHIITTKSDPQGRATVIDLLPKKLQNLNPVGRLDFDTSGLLLLTDDGDLLHMLTHPSHGVEKTYHARCGGKLTPEVVKILQEGVFIPEENSKKRVKTAPCRVTVKAQTETNALVEISLREGRNRQVRKMLEVMGHRVSSLRRVKFAGLELDELAPGDYRILLPGEVHALRKAAEKGFKIKASRAAKVPAVRPSKAKPKPEDDKKGFRTSTRTSGEDSEAPSTPYGAKSRAAKSSSTRSSSSRSSSDRSSSRPSDRSSRSSSDRSSSSRPSDRPSSSRSSADRPSSFRPSSDRSSYSKPSTDRPSSFRPSSDRSSSDRSSSRPPADRSSSKPPSDRSSKKPSSSPHKPGPLGERIRREWKE